MLNVSKSLTILLFSALATFAVGVPPQAALAASSCYKSHLVEDPFKSPMIRQWLQWETSVTLPDWSQERPISRLPIAQVSRQSVEVEALSKADILGLETIADSASSTVSWFKHPYNQNIKVPNFEAPVSGYGVAFHTASRTIVTKINSRLVSLKMPTDYPFGPSRHQQSEKIELHGDLKYSVARSKAILAIDNKIPEDPKLVIQKEIAAVIDKETRNGYLIRDMSALLDGHYYLPGHQLPYVGKVIAEKQGSDVATYWRQHWAAAIGRYQAKLLYRYGLEVRAVNPQNFLIQLNSNMEPTGVLVWRDLAESHLIEPIAAQIGLQDFINRDVKNGGWGVHKSVNIDNENIYWHFNSQTPTLTSKQKQEWEMAHELAYRSELATALELGIPIGESMLAYVNRQIKEGTESDLLKAIRRWHSEQSAKKNDNKNSSQSRQAS